MSEESLGAQFLMRDDDAAAPMPPAQKARRTVPWLMSSKFNKVLACREGYMAGIYDMCANCCLLRFPRTQNLVPILFHMIRG